VNPTASPSKSPARLKAIWLLIAGALVIVYGVAAPIAWNNRDWTSSGPLSFHAPAITKPLSSATSYTEITKACARVGNFATGYQLKVVGTHVGATDYYACYLVKSDGAVFEAAVVDQYGIRASDHIIKAEGAWRWIGTIKTPTELVLGEIAIIVVLGMYFLYYRRPRPGPPRPPRWWESQLASAILGVLGLLPLTLPFRRRETRGRRLRLLFQWLFGFVAFLFVIFLIAGISDRTTAVALGLIVLSMAFGWLGGQRLLRPADWGLPDGDATMTVLPVAAQRASPQSDPPKNIATVVPPGRLPSFAQVGGMSTLKDELADTLGLLLAFGGEADAYRISFNGILLHGPPGVGKTFFARATAGEFGLNFLHISTGDLISRYVGGSASNLKAVFAEAARNVPCLLFFDEFDSIAERRDDGIGEESKRVVNQLLQSLEQWRPVRDLIVMAATNHLDRLDPAVLRPGRFDRHIRVDLPDLLARHSILAAQLTGRPVEYGVDLDDLARRTEGRTPATLARIVEAAALSAFRSSTAQGRPVPITAMGLRQALDGLGGADRPTVENWSWDRLVLDDRVEAELRQIQALIADPDLATRYGVQVPSGVLLTGPPGTGKTTIARVFAAQAGCSFYPQTAADLTSKWVGESEAQVVRLFARARENAPSIIFIDEIDAIATTRSSTGSGVYERTLTQLLTEIDGITEQRGVFVMAATNRPDTIDAALLRGGRLSRTLEIPLPDVGARRRLLTLFTHPMPMSGVDLQALAALTGGYSGADLEALCQRAALRAMLHASTAGSTPAVVTPADFSGALAERRSDPVEPTEPAALDEFRPGGYL
jgi:SpoVK/Ycf46/Vps4 family AAA+-type ATPase